MRFSIADVANFSCVKAHTIRVWENRFSILVPSRNKGNVRYYTLDDTAQLLKLSLLNKAGFKISHLAAMDRNAIDHAIDEVSNEAYQQCRDIHSLIISMYAMNTEEFENILDKCTDEWGIDRTIMEIIIPFVERTSLFSCKNCNSEIDFAITALRRKMMVGIEKATASLKRDITFLLFLTEGDHYDLLLLYFNYIIKSNGLKTLYMGTNVSFEKVKNVIERKQPHYIVTYISPKHRIKVNKIKAFVHDLSGANLFIAGSGKAKKQTADFTPVHYSEVTRTLMAV